MSIETTLQRVDNYIQKQIHKFEQQKRGRTSPPRAYAGYGQLPRQDDAAFRSPARQHDTFRATPSAPHQIPMASMTPKDWTRDFDPRNQRWYYIHLATGRSQWEPPDQNSLQAPPPPPPPPPPSRSQTWDTEPLRHREQDCSARQRSRAVSQPRRPMPCSIGEHGVDVK